MFPQGGTGQLAKLRDVVAERRKDHVVDGLGRDAVCTGPGGLRQVRILDTPAHAALRSVVNLVPEPKSRFADGADIAGAGAAGRGRSRSGWRALAGAAGVVGERRAVTADSGVRGGDGRR